MSSPPLKWAHTHTSKFSAPPDQAPAARPPFSLQPFACNQTAAGEFLNLSDPPAADEELEKMTQALPHCSETRRRQPGARRATTNGSVCCFPSQIPSPSASRDSPRPPPSWGPEAPPGAALPVSAAPGGTAGGGGAGAEGEEAPRPPRLPPTAALCRTAASGGRGDSGTPRPGAKFACLRCLTRAGSGPHSPSAGRSRPPPPLTDRWRRAPPLPAAPQAPRGCGPPRTSRRRGGLRSSGGEKGGVTCRAGSRGLGSSRSRSCRSGGRERRWGGRPGAAPPPWRSRRSSTGSTRPPAGPPSTRWGAAARPGSAPSPGAEAGSAPSLTISLPPPSSAPPHPRGVCVWCVCAPAAERPAGRALPSASPLPGSELSLPPSPLPSRNTLRAGPPLRRALPSPFARLRPPEGAPLPAEQSPSHLLLLRATRWRGVPAAAATPPRRHGCGGLGRRRGGEGRGGGLLPRCRASGGRPGAGAGQQPRSAERSREGVSSGRSLSRALVLAPGSAWS